MAVTTAVVSGLSQSHLRLMDRRRDLYAVADLIELCFADTLDEDGRNYIKRLRYASFQAQPQWFPFAEDSVNLSGYVWEVDGQIVGNLSVLPYTGVFFPFDEKVMMIANVAVHPQYRRQGIARQLTERALYDLRRKGNDPIWLHVRMENVNAYRLYASLGFVEQFRRTIWVHDSPSMMIGMEYHPERCPLTFKRREKKDWDKQRAWFREAYPREMEWYYAVTPRLLQPGLIGTLYSMMSGITLSQWSVYVDQQIIGVGAFQPTNHYSDYLWLMVKPDLEDQAMHALLTFFAQHYTRRKPFSLDYPYQRGCEMLRRFGFREHQNLVWMKYDP